MKTDYVTVGSQKESAHFVISGYIKCADVWTGLRLGRPVITAKVVTRKIYWGGGVFSIIFRPFFSFLSPPFLPFPLSFPRLEVAPQIRPKGFGGALLAPPAEGRTMLAVAACTRHVSWAFSNMRRWLSLHIVLFL